MKRVVIALAVVLMFAPIIIGTSASAQQPAGGGAPDYGTQRTDDNDQDWGWVGLLGLTGLLGLRRRREEVHIPARDVHPSPAVSRS